MIDRQFHRLAPRENLFHLVPEVLPLGIPPKIIRHHESPVHKVTLEKPRIRVREDHSSRSRHIDKGIFLQVLRHDIDEVQAGMDLEAGDLEHPVGKAEVSLGAVVIPKPSATVPCANIRVKAQPGRK